MFGFAAAPLGRNKAAARDSAATWRMVLVIMGVPFSAWRATGILLILLQQAGKPLDDLRLVRVEVLCLSRIVREAVVLSGRLAVLRRHVGVFGEGGAADVGGHLDVALQNRQDAAA